MAISWRNSAFKEKLERLGLANATDFWDWRHSAASSSCAVQSEHFGRYSKGLLRQTLAIQLDDSTTCYLKLFQGAAFQHLVDELDAFEVVPKFGFTTAEVLATDFDHERRQGFLLLGQLKGFVSFRQIVNNKVSKDCLERIRDFKDECFDVVVGAFMSIWKDGYFYPDWRDKHIFVNPLSRQVGLIDLERFVHVTKCPWYYRFKRVETWLKRKECERLIDSLALDANERVELEARFGNALS